MTNEAIERRIAEAVAKTAPNDVNSVLSRIEPRKGKVIYMTTKKKTPILRNLIAACLVLALLGGGLFYQEAYAVTSIVSLDVNPSIELKVNKSERVLACEALNEEARTVLSTMNGGKDLEGTDLDVAVNAIVGALVRSGYLDSISSAILISVEDKDQNRASRIRRELTAAVDVVLQDRASDAAVLSQTVPKDTELEKKAKENNISTGKASLIDQVLALNSSLTFSQLSALSVEELKDILDTGAPGMPIGQEEALRLAKAHADLSGADLLRMEVDAELDDRIPHYDVELITADAEYDYEIDAYTGAVLTVVTEKPDKDDITPAPTVPPVTEPVTPPTAGTGITAEQAKTIALGHAGLTEGQVTGLEVSKDFDDGRNEYEIEFKSGKYEYDYTIDAATGAVLEHEKELDD